MTDTEIRNRSAKVKPSLTYEALEPRAREFDPEAFRKDVRGRSIGCYQRRRRLAIARARQEFSRSQDMTLNDLLDEAARVAMAERGKYVTMPSYVSAGLYIAFNEGLRLELRETYQGTKSNCQLWIERRVLEKVFGWIGEKSRECPDLIGCKFREGIEALAGEVAI